MRLHLFNPDNDLALASGLNRYTPPRAALQLRQAGEALPLWYADEGDRVLSYGINAAWLDRMLADFSIKAEPYDHSSLLSPDPWGWSAAAKTDFIDGGLDLEALPSDDKIATLRQLSHRRTASLLAKNIIHLLPDLQLACPPAIEAFGLEEVEAAMKRWGAIVAKAPWSSSGRGVANSLIVGRERTLKMAGDSIRRQGSVMVEQAVNKTFDFAKIFECHAGHCREIGTSVFFTGQSGAYTGNLMASEPERLRRVSQHADLATVGAVTEAARISIEAMIAPHYDGILGVDMLTDTDGRIHPAVEINLRKTMGYVAIALSDRILSDGAIGEFSVSPTKTQQTTASTYSVSDGKLTDGTLLLTPPSPHFTFQARIIW